MSEKMSAYIASGYHLLRRMFCSFISTECGMTVLGEAADGETACQEIRRMKPQLVLLDIELPVLSGLKLTERILAETPETRIIAVTTEPEEGWLIEFLQLGGMGYLRDCRTDADILTAIQRAMEGKKYLEDAGIQLLLDRACKKTQTNIAEASDGEVSPRILSDRERHVLHLYARGYSSVDIASMLFISASTVGTYIRRLREKLRLEHKSELVEYAIKFNLYDDWQ